LSYASTRTSARQSATEFVYLKQVGIFVKFFLGTKKNHAPSAATDGALPLLCIPLTRGSMPGAADFSSCAAPPPLSDAHAHGKYQNGWRFPAG